MKPRALTVLVFVLALGQLATTAGLLWLLSRQSTTQVSFPISLIPKQRPETRD